MENKTEFCDLKKPFEEAILFLIKQRKDNLESNPFYQEEYRYLCDLYHRMMTEKLNGSDTMDKEKALQ